MLEKTLADRLIALHKECFNDGDYAEFFFKYRVPHGKCFYLEENGVAVSVAHVRFLTIVIGNEKVKVPFFTGVATAHEYRGKGLASKVLNDAKLALINDGYPFAMLHTYIPDFYRKLGFTVANTVGYVEPADTPEDGVEFKAMQQCDLPTVHELYKTLMSKHFSYCSRTLKETELLIGTSLKYGGSGYVIYKNGIPSGYVWYDDGICSEALATDDNLFNGCPFANRYRIPKMGGETDYSMALTLNVESLMKIIPYKNESKSICFSINDKNYELTVENGKFKNLVQTAKPAQTITEEELTAISLGHGEICSHPLKDIVKRYNIACFEIY